MSGRGLAKQILFEDLAQTIYVIETYFFFDEVAEKRTRKLWNLLDFDALSRRFQVHIRYIFFVSLFIFFFDKLDQILDS